MRVRMPSGVSVKPSGLHWRWDACDREWQLERDGERVGHVRILWYQGCTEWVGANRSGIVSTGTLDQCARDLVREATR